MKKLIFLSLLLSITGQIFGQTRIQRLEQAYHVLVNDPQAKYAQTTLYVLDATTGKVLFGDNENKGFATASTLKTITGATALDVLGQDYVYTTTLSRTGTISNGVLTGSLVIKGSGDPTLGSWRYDQSKEGTILSQWVDAIKKAGIQRIVGSIIGDDSVWPSQSVPEGWIWQDIGNYYGAAPTALNWRENQFDVKLKPGIRTGDAVTITRTVPEMPYMKLENELTTGKPGSGDNAYGFIAPYTELGYIRGAWGIGISKAGISLSMPDPAFDVAHRLADTLQRLGIAVSEPATTSRRLTLSHVEMPPNTTPISTIQSPKLSEIIYWFEKKSINLYGEALLKTLAAAAGLPATTHNGAQTVIKYWKDRGIDENALNIIDGSGLSPGTRVTPAAMGSVLFQAQKASWFPAYYKAFPENNNMKLKSGSINGVSAYAGYHTDTQGNKYIIVIMINNYNGGGISRKLFRVLDALK